MDDNIWPLKANSGAGKQHCGAPLEVQLNQVCIKRLHSFHGSTSETTAWTNYFVCFWSHYKWYPAAPGATCLRRLRRCIFSPCLVTNQQKRHRVESLSNAFPAPIKSFAHEPTGFKSILWSGENQTSLVETICRCGRWRLGCIYFSEWRSGRGGDWGVHSENDKLWA